MSSELKEITASVAEPAGEVEPDFAGRSRAAPGPLAYPLGDVEKVLDFIWAMQQILKNIKNIKNIKKIKTYKNY